MVTTIRVPDNAAVEMMLAYILHNETVRNEAVRCLKEEHFDKPEFRVYATSWHVMLTYFNETGRMPDQNVLECEVLNNLNNDPDVLEETKNDATDFIRWLYGSENTKESLKESSHGISLVKVFVLDYIRRQAALQMSDNVAAISNIKLPQIVRQISDELESISNIGVDVGYEAIPEQWPTQAGEPFRTGVSLLDNYMETYPGDVNVILGPTGGGKTMLSLQIMVGVAWRLYSSGREDAGWCAYFGYEDDRIAPAKRIIANAAKIPYRKLQNLKSYDELSTADNLDVYERKLMSKTGIKKGERERLEEAKTWINRHIVLFDFSGRPDANGISHGHGGLPEVKTALQRTMDKLKRPVELLIVDWAGLLVNRYLQKSGRNAEKAITAELEHFVDNVYQITSTYKCVAFVVHQLRGAANRLSPVAPVTHADAAWCSNFGVNAWNIICLGNKDLDSGAFTLSWTKCRRTKTKKNLICYIDGDYCRVMDDKQFYMDYATKQILEEQESVYSEENSGVRSMFA